MDAKMDKSRLPGFYKLSVPERVNLVHERGMLSREDFQTLSSGRHTLTTDRADKMIENVIGGRGLPLGLGLNGLVNGQGYGGPRVGEEPARAAARGCAANQAR